MLTHKPKGVADGLALSSSKLVKARLDPSANTGTFHSADLGAMARSCPNSPHAEEEGASKRAKLES